MVFGAPLTLCESLAAYPLTDVHLMQLAMTEVEHDPLVALEVLRQQSQRLRQASELTAVLQCKRAPARLRQLLHWLAAEIGDPNPQGTRLAVRLTHQQLAQAACTTRVTVTRLMQALQAEGGLIWDRDRHLILTPTFFAEND
jgi:CRP-like cAMP-binding protein